MDLQAVFDQTTKEMTWEEVVATIQSMAEDMSEDTTIYPPPVFPCSSPFVAGQDVPEASQPHLLNPLSGENARSVPLGAAPCSSEDPLHLETAPGLNAEQSSLITDRGPLGPIQAGVTPADYAAPSVVPNTTSEQTEFEAELRELMTTLPSLADLASWYSPPPSPPRSPDSEPSSGPLLVLGKPNSSQLQPMEIESSDCRPQPVAFPGVNVVHCASIKYQGQVTQSDFPSSDSGAPPVVSLKRKRSDQDEGVPYVKKPLNAFMLYRKEQRPHVAAQLNISNSGELNRVLGQKWKSLLPEEKTKYYEEAEREKLIHILEYPTWSCKDNYGKKRKRHRRKVRPGDEAAQTSKEQRVEPVQTDLDHGEYHQWNNQTQTPATDYTYLYPCPTLTTIDLSAFHQT
ncbi:transcription factor 7-like 1 [Mugil cephalus]|uniref:transcription factor 7-like 1 n=1 Tax=Mugil cephalus TaxID=48193 RepID=UPI001FB7CB9A|nr:transcription factor 7-like 1 [Mugil cephalus]